MRNFSSSIATIFHFPIAIEIIAHFSVDSIGLDVCIICIFIGIVLKKLTNFIGIQRDKLIMAYIKSEKVL